MTAVRHDSKFEFGHRGGVHPMRVDSIDRAEQEKGALTFAFRWPRSLAVDSCPSA